MFTMMGLDVITNGLGTDRTERNMKAWALERLLSRGQGAEGTEACQQLKSRLDENGNFISHLKKQTPLMTCYLFF